jgi:glucan biosynthesis protein C
MFYLASLILVLCLDRPAGPLRKRLRTLQAAILVGDLRWMRLPLLVSLSVLATLGDHTPELAISHRLRPDPETFTAHYVFFLAGWMFALHREILGDLDRWAGLRFLFGLLLAIFVVVPLGNNHVGAATAAELWLGSRPIQMGIYWLLHAMATWLMVLGMLGLAERWFTRVNPRFAYVAEAAFWIYLAHLPFAVFIPVLLHDWSLDADLKMWISSAIVLAICFASYHFLVRGTVIGRWLRGRYRRSPRPRSSSVSGPSTE